MARTGRAWASAFPGSSRPNMDLGRFTHSYLRLYTTLSGTHCHGLGKHLALFLEPRGLLSLSSCCRFLCPWDSTRQGGGPMFANLDWRKRDVAGSPMVEEWSAAPGRSNL